MDESPHPVSTLDPTADLPHVPGYRVTRRVARGGTSTVYRARRESDDSLVALKVLDADADERALREHELLAQSALEHCVGVHGWATTQGEGGPRPVLVLDWMAGGSLRDVVGARGFLSAGECVTVLVPLATALGQLHRLGVVHGDVSPGNVLLDSTGRPVWSDLGWSRLVGVDPGEADLWGTEGYVAPEVTLGRQPSAASDVFGLGAIAWACLTGAAPGHRATRPVLAEVAPQAPPELRAVVEECLEPDPAARPDVDDVAARVFAAADAEPLVLVVPCDVDSSLTRRIREAAVADIHPDDLPVWERDLTLEEPRRWWRPWRRDDEIDLSRDEPAPASTSRTGRRPAPAGRRHAARDRGGGAHAGAVDRSTVRSWVLPGAALALAVVLSVLVPWERLAQAEQAPGASTSSTSGSGGGAAAGEPAEGEAALDPRAARERPAELMTELARLRARVLTEQDGDLLARLVVPGSPAERADRAVLRRLGEGGHSYTGLAHRVSGVSLVRSSSSTDVVLRASIATSAYSVSGPAARRRPAQPAVITDVHLTYRDGRWRVVDLRQP